MRARTRSGGRGQALPPKRGPNPAEQISGKGRRGRRRGPGGPRGGARERRVPPGAGTAEAAALAEGLGKPPVLGAGTRRPGSDRGRARRGLTGGGRPGLPRPRPQCPFSLS